MFYDQVTLTTRTLTKTTPFVNNAVRNTKILEIEALKCCIKDKKIHKYQVENDFHSKGKKTVTWLLDIFVIKTNCC